MRRLRKILLWLLAALIAIPVVAVAALFAALNTSAGQDFAASEITSLTGRTIVLGGLSGRFPDHLRLAHLEVNDVKGPYLTADDVALDWSPLALVGKQALVHNLTARTLSFARLPESDPNAPQAPANPNAKPFQLPVEVTVEHLAVPQATLGAPLLGAPAIASLEGRLDLPTLLTGTAALHITRTDAPGAYNLTAAITADTIDAHLAATEPDGGLAATAAKLPALGPLALRADITGPRNALATTLALNAGPLTAAAAGTIDLPGSRLALDIHAHAPAMQPAPGIAWQSVALDTHVAGPFTTPDATGHLQITGLAAEGAGAKTITADLAGNAGQATIHAAVDALTIPGPNPGLLAASPLTLDLAARLDDPARPVTYRLSHPLIQLAGTAKTAGALATDATLTLPDLAPLAAAANQTAAGHTTLALHAAQPTPGTTTFSTDGTLTLTAGPAPAPALLGTDAKIAIAGQLAGTTLTVSRANIAGAALTLDATATKTDTNLDTTAKLTLANLALLAPTLTGAATLDAHAHGPTDALALDATLHGDVGAPNIPRGPVTVTANLTGLPTAPTGHITATGILDAAPLDLALDATRDPAGTLHATITRADWRSLHADGALTLNPGATLPEGHIALRFPQLADLRPLIGKPVAGSLAATLTVDPGAATLTADLHNAGLPGTTIGRAQLNAHVTDPLAHPVIAATLTADGIDASNTTGAARVEVNGPETALAIRSTAHLTASGTPADIAAAALLDLPAKQVRLETLTVDAKPAALSAPTAVRLLAPATIRFGTGVAVDRLRLAAAGATLDLAGELSPALNATASVKANIADLPLPRTGEGRAEASAYTGAVTLDAKLTGTPAQPGGTVRLAATGLHARTGDAAALPPAAVTATATLRGHDARIDARATAGSATLALNGTAPLGAGPLDLHTTGALDLTLLDPILTASGRRAMGRLTFDATAAGTLAAPRLSGQAQLAGGDIQDFTQGVHIANLAATITADGQTIRLASLTGHAGPGTIAASGTIGVLAPGLPVDLTITMRNARPLASPTITADLNADLTVKGAVERGLDLAGRIGIERATLNIPDNLPGSVAVLPVHRPGDKPAPPAAPAAPIGLDLTIDAPGQIFVRGRGVDAVMGGTLTVHGSSTKPQVGGGLDMRSGSVSVAGTTLSFTRGRVGFDGTGVSGKIDPTLDFLATSTTTGVTAMLAITGYVSKPKITLSSEPELPQDEVLSYLLFKQSAKSLGPFQIAEIAAGLVQLTGAGGSGGFNPLDTVRKGLGLDRLTLGSSTTTGTTAAANTTNPTVEGGKYVANGVYVGAKQGTTGNQTQATVQIDITKGLKLETDAGTGPGGNQVGLTYQFEY